MRWSASLVWLAVGCGRIDFDPAGSVSDNDGPVPTNNPVTVGSDDLPAPLGATGINDVAVDGERMIASGPGGTAIYELGSDGTWTSFELAISGTAVDIDGDLASIGWEQGARIVDRRSGAWVVAEQYNGFGVRGLGTAFVAGVNYRLVRRIDNDPGTEVELHHYDWNGQAWSRDVEIDVLLVQDGATSATASAATHRGSAVITMGTNGVYGADGVTASSAAENSIAIWSDSSTTRIAVAQLAENRVVIWERSGTTFAEIATIAAPVPGVRFGDAIAFVGPRVIAIGAPEEDAGAGAVYTFGDAPAGWTLGERIVVGAVGIGSALDGGPDSLVIAGRTSRFLRRMRFSTD